MKRKITLDITVTDVPALYESARALPDADMADLLHVDNTVNMDACLLAVYESHAGLEINATLESTVVNGASNLIAALSAEYQECKKVHMQVVEQQQWAINRHMNKLADAYRIALAHTEAQTRKAEWALRTAQHHIGS